MQHRTRPRPAPSSTEASPPSLKRQDAATRSAQLTSLFDRPSGPVPKVRQGAHLGKDFADGLTGEGVKGILSPTLLSRRLPPSTSAPLSHPAGGISSSSTGGAVLRSGGAPVLPTNSCGLPHFFSEQSRAVLSVEITSAEIQRTLQQLHHDLDFHAKRRIEAGRDAGCYLASAPRSHPSADSTSVTLLTGEATDTQQRRMAEVDTLSEAANIQRARAAAADEGASDDQSVEDYGVDCEVPPLTSDSRLADEVAAIAVCLAKMKESAGVMYDTEAAASSTSVAPWWSSALGMRDMKVSVARLDYHAHSALSWSHRSREQLLLQAVMLNNASAATREQLFQQQNRLQEFQARLSDGQQAATQLQADIAQYQARVQAEMTRRAALQEELRLCAQERGLVDSAERNPLKAELALLLEEREWPSHTLKRDASVVLGWLRSVSTALE
ncbi:conserved hypothetical protein [Leishmania braziliensis MHOM/BR/75/M2904]|uniref:Uncharacterized protein n=2 Tax=Leishmania braziliensis TaxID=5660 RepID=A4HG32_LEIBR|nr:conserved hypothetical protein [Leishmania braziliensis MHOM/BR/75/M2904]CAI5813426.1 hypothetical_protein [Leishmania braziliensis MHOM/BR/75/M2904]CAJ2475516.1 unnamed protein product [Leishmania braziliensis]CAM45550.1 conserved hypothetical protein [Leishmania braziliensis MHOM/BR/75/M2904]